MFTNVRTVGLALGCDRCVLPIGFAGTEFSQVEGETVCGFCLNHTVPTFRGGEQLIRDLNLGPEENVGITVSGGKDSAYAWMWLVDTFGPERVIAFNHNKVGLVHPLALQNLHNASHALESQLIMVDDHEMLPRFRANLAAFLAFPNASMVRVALCAGCRVGISGKMFAAGQQYGITKFLSAASYLELAPFKAALMKTKGGGDEHQGLLVGIAENPGYGYGNNLQVFLLEDQHCHKAQLTGGGSYALYPGITFFDFDTYFPNVPDLYERAVRQRFGWECPGRSWHFDCLIEVFKDLFYYGLLGYTEMDCKLSAMVRYGLLSREEAFNRLMQSRFTVINSLENVKDLMKQFGVGHLIPQIEKFYQESRFLSERE